MQRAPSFSPKFSISLKSLSFYLALLCVIGPVNAQDDPQSFYWQPYDETRDIAQQANHDNPRLRFIRFNSTYLDKNTLWDPFTEELANFTAQEYEALKPLVLEQDIPSLQRSVAEGRLSYELLVKFYLYRIRSIESDNAQALNAVIATNPEVINEARRKDRARSVDGVAIDEYSLFGIPVLLKDNIGTATMPTTAGAAVLQNNQTDDAFITERLKANGAIILGKANLSEWAYYFCDACPSGYSAMGGQTLNPYSRSQFGSGGSSSGSGVAVAANYAPVAVGSETSGSILSPSSANSVVGLKPTTGMLSRTGVVPISSTLDTTGPIAKNVTDAIILFNAMTGYDDRDMAMPLLSADATLVHREESLAGKRLGYFSNFTDNELYNGVLDALRAAGAELVMIDPPDVQLSNFGNFLGAEMINDLASYLADHGGESVDVATVQDILAYNYNNGPRRAPYGQGRFEAMHSGEYSATQVDAMREQIRATGIEALSTPVVENDLDALLSVNNSHAAFAAAANFPALTIPMGYRDTGAPAGITLIGPSFAEQQLVDMGLAVEALLQARVIPEDYQ